MANYIEFRRVLDKQGKPRRFTYVCGNQPVLREAALDVIKGLVEVEVHNSVNLSVVEDGTAAVWAAMNQYALDSRKKRLVVVRDAEKITEWAQFEPWLMSRSMTNIHVVFMANEPEWPVDRNEEARVRLVKASTAIYVECSFPKGLYDRKHVDFMVARGGGSPYTKAEVMAAKIACTWCPGLGMNDAAALARRVGVDMARIRDVCTWMSLLPGLPQAKAIELLARPTPELGFTEALIHNDKPTAIQASRELESRQIPGVVRYLARKLTDLEKINRVMRPALQKHESNVSAAISEVRSQTGLSHTAVHELWDAAKFYDTRAVSRRTRALIRADENRGNMGVIEVLIAEW